MNDFDPFAQNFDTPVFVPTARPVPEHISEPLKEKFAASNDNPYVNYQYINEAWHNPSHGIDVTNEEKLAVFFNDFEKSATIWEESGIYLGFIMQAVQNDTVIDMGMPIGLVQDSIIDPEDEQKVHHITIAEAKEIIQMYREYLVDQVFDKNDDFKMEIKPFYAINNQEISYEVVEQNYNKRLKIK